MCPGYRVMVVARAALECSPGHLAAELGDHGIRVSIISGGLIGPLSVVTISGEDMFEWTERNWPLCRHHEAAELGRTAMHLIGGLIGRRERRKHVLGSRLRLSRTFSVCDSLPAKHALALLKTRKAAAPAVRVRTHRADLQAGNVCPVTAWAGRRGDSVQRA